MNRNTTYIMPLLGLLAGCASATINLPTQAPLVTATLPIISTLTLTSTPLATDIVSSIPPCSDVQKRNLKIMPLGDSITYGTGDLSYGGYRNLLGVLLTTDGYSIDFVGSQKNGDGVIPDPDNEGHPGWRISNIKQGIDSENWLETYQPDIILLHIGSNDLRNGNQVYVRDSLSVLLDDILARLPKTYIIVAQIIPTRWGADSNNHLYNDAIPGIVAAKGTRVSIADMRNILSKKDFLTLYHPNAGGYDKMAHAWESAILALGIPGGCLISR